MTGFELHRDVDLTQANTLRLPSRAQFAVRARTIEELRRALAWIADSRLPLTILGGGSNVVMQRVVAGCVVQPELRFIEIDSQDDRVLLRAGAGLTWHDLVRFSLGQGLFGLENLALIPGRVGGAPMQNIGAYGVEVESFVHNVEVVDVASGDRRTLEPDECAFGYRDSRFRREPVPRQVITAVTFELSRHGTPVTSYPDVATELRRMGRHGTAAVDVAEAVIRIRRRKLPDPRVVPNAGSFFKNPVVDAARLDALTCELGPMNAFPTAGGYKVPAAQLIDACGFKRRPAERVAVWPRQALVLINRGGADADDVLDFAHIIAEEVGHRFGVALEVEPRLVG